MENKNTDHSPAVSYTEYRLTRLWRRILGRHNISSTMPFTSLGGNPDQAADLFSLVEQEFDCHLDLASFKYFSSVRLMAEQIDKKTPKSEWSDIVKIREGADSPPLFLVHDIHGSILYAHALIKNMDFSCPVYALQSATLAGKCSTHRSLEEMAACYVDSVLSVEPDGPYWIGGFSYGGVVAFEIACQLVALGKTVHTIFIFDSLPPRRDANLYDFPYQKTASPPQGKSKGTESGEGVMLGGYKKRSVFKYFKRKVQGILIINRFEILTRLGFWQPMKLRVKYSKRFYRRLFNHYHPSQSDVSVCLFRSSGWAYMGTEGWAELCLKGLREIRVPDEHGEMFRQPRVQRVGAIVSNVMAEIELQD